MLMIVLFTYFWSSDPLSHPYSQALTLTPYSHVSFHLISFLPLSYTYHDYHPSPLSPHIT